MPKLPISKRQIKNNIAYDWWKYLCIIIATSIAWYFCYNLKDQIKKNEMIQIYVSCEITDYGVEEELETKFKENGIYDFYFYNYTSESSKSTALSAQGLSNSDLMIISDSDLETLGTSINYLINLNQGIKSEIDSISTEYNYLSDSDSIYALQINDKSNENYNSLFSFSKWLNFNNQNYYIVIPSDSVNIGQYGEKANNEDHFAIDTLLYLLSRK